MSDETDKPRRVGIVEMNAGWWEQLAKIGETCPVRFYTGRAVYNELMKISVALQDIHHVRTETAEIIAEDVEQRVFGIVASLLGMAAKEEGAAS